MKTEIHCGKNVEQIQNSIQFKSPEFTLQYEFPVSVEKINPAHT